MRPGITATKFGRRQAPEPARLSRLALYRGEQLTTTDWEPPLPVLDQEDLIAQGIRTSTFIPGEGQDVDALGSCTCNAGTAALAQYRVAHNIDAAATVLGTVPLDAQDAVAAERFAIALYHLVTDETGDPADEWPPTDCGSTGYAVCQELIRLGFVGSYASAQDMHSLALLLQTAPVMVGMPFFTAWMDPDPGGFVDGQGSVADLDNAISSGVAGGHETCIAALERVTLLPTGQIDLERSHVRVRNSWSSAWGDHGSYRLHLSTLDRLGGYADYKQLTP